MDSEFGPQALAGIDVIIHAAYIRWSRDNRDAAERNIRATRSLYDAAVQSGVRVVFLSSLSARENAKSQYGVQKYALERMLSETDSLIVRAGLVVGDGGLIRSLYLSMRSGFIPLIDGGSQPVQVIGTEDLAAAIALALEEGLGGRQNVCSEEIIPIVEIAHSMAMQFHLRPRYISVPWGPAYVVAALAERLGLSLPLTTENLMGLRAAEPERPSSALFDLGWRALPWATLLPALSFEPKAA
jgi:nucleoside-diphosphate-sugar epimerase